MQVTSRWHLGTEPAWAEILGDGGAGKGLCGRSWEVVTANDNDGK